MITPLLRALKKDGHHVTLNCNQRTFDVLKHNPNIDKFILNTKDMKIPDLNEYWKELGKGFDESINLSGSIEERLLRKEGSESFYWPHHKRHNACNLNYVEITLRDGGHEGSDPKTELHFTPLEHQEAKKWKKKYKDYFTILWSLSGSSFHKTYPYAEYVAMALMKKYPDILIATVGDEICGLLEWRHERTKCYSGNWSIRKSFIMTKYVDCVVGTETGVLNAASAFDTPKVIMLSHSSEENLTKHWDNCTNLGANVECRPCHRLIYTLEACPLEPGLRAPVCMSQLHSRAVFNAIEEVYIKWRNQKWEHSTVGIGRSGPKETGFLTDRTSGLSMTA